jgi:hypothetical protein
MWLLLPMMVQNNFTCKGNLEILPISIHLWGTSLGTVHLLCWMLVILSETTTELIKQEFSLLSSYGRIDTCFYF